jgi:hypothetical protein
VEAVSRRGLAARAPGATGGHQPRRLGTWEGWFESWWAANWGPDDLPSLRLVIGLWDRVNRGDIKRAAELRQWMDSYGITPKGQQDRRWARPLPPRAPGKLDQFLVPSRYAHLRDAPPASERFRGLDQRRQPSVEKDQSSTRIDDHRLTYQPE